MKQKGQKWERQQKTTKTIELGGGRRRTREPVDYVDRNKRMTRTGMNGRRCRLSSSPSSCQQNSDCSSNSKKKKNRSLNQFFAASPSAVHSIKTSREKSRKDKIEKKEYQRRDERRDREEMENGGLAVGTREKKSRKSRSHPQKERSKWKT